MRRGERRRNRQMRALALIPRENRGSMAIPGLEGGTEPVGPSGSDPPVGRLDSWKVIAEYLQRDVATVRRWEKQGLPVRRVPGGRGTSVFAYKSEIDAWLRRGDPDAPSPVPQATSPRAWRSTRASAAAVVLGAFGLAGVGVAWWGLGASRVPLGNLRVSLEPDAIVAVDARGATAWRHALPAAFRYVPSGVDHASRVVLGPPPGVYVASAQRFARADDTEGGGELFVLTPDGALRWSFELSDETVFGGQRFGPPWSIHSFAVDDRAGGRRIAVAAHHYHWSATLVVLLDDEGKRLSTFGHWGWIDNVRWVAANRLLVSGFSDDRNAGMVALLDPAQMNGQGPQPDGRPHYCEGCGDAQPIRVVSLPRSELNEASLSPFNRALVQVVADRIIAHTIEVPAVNQEAVDVLYEFTPELELRSAQFSARYWEIHSALEARGQLDHTREQCPDRAGPRAVQVWEPATGWRTVATRRLSPRPSNPQALKPSNPQTLKPSSPPECRDRMTSHGRRVDRSGGGPGRSVGRVRQLGLHQPPAAGRARRGASARS
jgi:hypothetical protein